MATPTKQATQNSQPQEVSENNNETSLKKSIVISTTAPEDLNSNTSTPKARDFSKGLLQLHSKLDHCLSRSPILAANPQTPQAHVNPFGYEIKTLASVEDTVARNLNSFFSPSPSTPMRPDLSYQYSSAPVYWSQPNIPLSPVISPVLHVGSVAYPAKYPAPPVQQYQSITVYHGNARYVVPQGTDVLGFTHQLACQNTGNVSARTPVRDRNYYCGEVSNDDDSVILDYVDQTTEVSDDEGDRRAKKNNKKGKETTKPTDSQFVRKVKDSRPKRQEVEPAHAKKFFDKPSQIEDFDFKPKLK